MVVDTAVCFPIKRKPSDAISRGITGLHSSTRGPGGRRVDASVSLRDSGCHGGSGSYYHPSNSVILCILMATCPCLDNMVEKHSWVSASWVHTEKCPCERIGISEFICGWAVARCVNEPIDNESHFQDIEGRIIIALLRSNWDTVTHLMRLLVTILISPELETQITKWRVMQVDVWSAWKSASITHLLFFSLCNPQG